jgi:hypothetical protein
MRPPTYVPNEEGGEEAAESAVGRCHPGRVQAHISPSQDCCCNACAGRVDRGEDVEGSAGRRQEAEVSGKCECKSTKANTKQAADPQKKTCLAAACVFTGSAAVGGKWV